MTTSAIDSAREPHVAYASFTARVRALLTDVIIQSSAAVAIFFTAAALENVPGAGRFAVAGLFGVWLLYEPVQVALKGATFGHRRANIRIVRDGSDAKPSFGLAFIRFLLKSILGLPSFAVMLFTRRHQALHDVLTHTTVQVIDIDHAGEFDMIEERSAATPGTIMPSWGQRVIVSGAYMFLLWNVAIVAMARFVSYECLTDVQCTAGEELGKNALTFAVIVLMIAIPILGWCGRLPLARRRTMRVPSAQTDAHAHERL